jgi:hypothetical protein
MGEFGSYIRQTFYQKWLREHHADDQELFALLADEHDRYSRLLTYSGRSGVYRAIADYVAELSRWNNAAASLRD